MLESIVIGSGFAFAAAIQPGPLQAYLFSSVSQHGWKHTLPASLAPLLSDGPIALLVLLLLHSLSSPLYGILQTLGGILLLYYAWMSFQQWRHSVAIKSSQNGSIPRTMLQAAMVNILNPNPYLGWSLVLGPVVLSSWHHHPLHALMLILSFYTTLIVVTACTIVLFGTSRYLSQAGQRMLILISAIILALIGLYQLGASLLRAVSR